MATDPTLTGRLRAVAGLEVVDDDALRDAAALDFGGVARGTVRSLVRPATIDVVAALMSLANEEGWSLTPRGLGYSQSGQSIPADGISVEMSAFDEVHVDPERRTARCGAAVTWRRLLGVTAPLGLAPEVMPLNLDLSIGGTLSAGGTGSTSHRYGMAVSSVDSLCVVTGSGETVVATPTQRRDVYDAVLGGAGRFGIVCSAELRLRAMQPVTRTFCLLYDDASTMLADQRALMTAPWCTHIEGFASAAVQGLKRGPTGRRAPFARWFYGLHVSSELTPDRADPSAAECLAGLAHRELLHVEDSDSADFAARYDLRFEVMRATGTWKQTHPWLECMLPYEAAVELLPDLVTRLPLFIGDGHRIMPIGDVPRPELLAMPDGRPTIAFAVLPVGIPPAFEKVALAALRDAHDRLLDAGGKRYLSGWLFEPDESAWRRHFGDLFDAWRSRKQQLDPRGVLRSRLWPNG